MSCGVCTNTNGGEAWAYRQQEYEQKEQNYDVFEQFQSNYNGTKVLM